MKTIAHLSDLHFGRIDQTVSDALAAEVRAADPDIVVVSGDMTQRARKQEFAQARAFLDTLPYPQLVVPGNHDVPTGSHRRGFVKILPSPSSPARRYRHRHLHWPLRRDGESPR
ncbi:hypothetical protein EN979_36005, partial [Mesorhizobium sp. M7A.F.Ca.US.001.04.2.1]|uniref:metallophosphoesterase n=1 Tax=Mesorhizobium sp. M7A.F.Ca.US.001.04.2.1 TaxID=2496727 RepID=UPI000FD3B90A